MAFSGASGRSKSTWPIARKKEFSWKRETTIFSDHQMVKQIKKLEVKFDLPLQHLQQLIEGHNYQRDSKTCQPTRGNPAKLKAKTEQKSLHWYPDPRWVKTASFFFSVRNNNHAL